MWPESIIWFKRGCREAVWSKFEKFEVLENEVKVTKSTHFSPPNNEYVSLVKIHPLIKEIRMQTRSYADADADGIGTKCNMSPPLRLWGDIKTLWLSICKFVSVGSGLRYIIFKNLRF